MSGRRITSTPAGRASPVHKGMPAFQHASVFEAMPIIVELTGIRENLPDSEEERFLRQACGIWPGLPYKTRQSLLRVLIATGIVVMCVGQKDEFQGLRRWGITVRRRMHEFPNQSRSRSVFSMPYSWLVLFYVRQFQSVSFHFVLPLQPKPEYQRKDSE